jgi:hypothetical protein
MGVDLLPGPNITDIEYADDIVLLGQSEEIMQRFLNKLSDTARIFGMKFAPSKCKVLLQDWVGGNPNLAIGGIDLDIVDSFTYLGSKISSAFNASDEINSRIVKARTAFAKLSHIWRRKDIRLPVKGRLYTACVRSILLYGSETWSLRVEDVQKLSVFDNRCLRTVAKVRWDEGVSNAEVHRRVFRNARDCRPIAFVINLHRLRWLGHVLRMQRNRLPYRTIFAEPAPGWKKPTGGQHMTWLRNMKALTLPLSKIGRYRLPGWGPRDHPLSWLQTLSDIAACRSQWRACIHSISNSTN